LKIGGLIKSIYSMFDILITVAPKDYNKLPFVMRSIMLNMPDYHTIYLVSNDCIPHDKIPIEAKCYLDQYVLDYDFSKINMESRRGWYRQQFIKLLQTVTLDNYLVVDADICINKPVIIDLTHPYFYLGRDQNHAPYFECFNLICRLERVYPYSFISEMMFFKREIMQHLLNGLGVNVQEFLNICIAAINIVNDGSSFSEYEFYGNYVTKHWPDLYQYKKINVFHQKKKRKWTDDEIRNYIDEYKGTNYDLLTMHSWI